MFETQVTVALFSVRITIDYFCTLIGTKVSVLMRGRPDTAIRKKYPSSCWPKTTNSRVEKLIVNSWKKAKRKQSIGFQFDPLQLLTINHASTRYSFLIKVEIVVNSNFSRLKVHGLRWYRKKWSDNLESTSRKKFRPKTTYIFRKYSRILKNVNLAATSKCIELFSIPAKTNDTEINQWQVNKRLNEIGVPPLRYCNRKNWIPSRKFHKINKKTNCY